MTPKNGPKGQVFTVFSPKTFEVDPGKADDNELIMLEVADFLKAN